MRYSSSRSFFYSSRQTCCSLLRVENTACGLVVKLYDLSLLNYLLLSPSDPFHIVSIWTNPCNSFRSVISDTSIVFLLVSLYSVILTWILSLTQTDVIKRLFICSQKPACLPATTLWLCPAALLPAQKSNSLFNK